MKKYAAFLLLLFLLAHTSGFTQPSKQQLKREAAWHATKLCLGFWLLGAGVFSAALPFNGPSSKEGFICCNGELTCTCGASLNCNKQHTFSSSSENNLSYLYFSFNTVPTFVSAISLIVSGIKGIDNVRKQEFLLETCPGMEDDAVEVG